MLGANFRLKKDRDFSRVLSTGQKTLFGPLLIFTAEAETDYPRFGVVVSKRVSPKAVVRNKIRRQLAHLLRPLVENHPTACDVVLLVLRPAEFDQYQSALTQWQKKSLSA